MGLGRIDVLAGDFKKGKESQFIGGKFLMKNEGRFFRETITLSGLERVELATEENVVSIGGAAGWGLAGSLLLGPAGLLAGLLLGGRGKDTTFICVFKDGRKFLGTAASGVFAELQKYTMSRAFM